MKTKFILNFAALIMSLSSYSQIKIYSGGSVSYGSTTAPSSGEKHKFIGHVVINSTAGGTSSSIYLRANNGLSNATTPEYTWLGNDQTGLFHPATNVIGFTTGGTERARLTTYGNLLMGTTSVENSRINTVSSGFGGLYSKATYAGDWGPSIIEAETDRSNSVMYKGSITGGSTTFYVAGAGWIYSQGNYLGSDKDIKDDIKKIDSALTKVLQLNGVTYKLKKEKQNPNLYPTPQEYIGVIAQDVEKVAPQAVKVVLDGTKAVNYDMLIGLLIEALKEQNAKVAQLENDVNNCCAKTTTTTQQNRMMNTTPETTGDIYTGSSYIKQNIPNPFNKETSIDYFIAEKNADASILVFDMSGKLLKTYKLQTDKSSLLINGNELSPGMYYYSLVVNNKEVGTKKMILTE